MYTGRPPAPLDYWLAKDMLLRDYFAAKALEGFLSKGSNMLYEDLSRIAYSIADKMMEARVGE